MEDSGEDSTQISSKNSGQEAPDDDKEIEKCPELEEKTADNSDMTIDQNLINSIKQMEAESPLKNSDDNQQQENIPSVVSEDDDNDDILIKKPTKSRFQTIIDSDSDDDTSSIQQSNSPVDDFNDDKSMKLKKQSLSCIDSDEDDNEDESQKNKENLMDDNEPKKKSNKISALIDSESEEDVEKRISNNPVEEIPKKSVGKKSKKQKVEKKKNVSERAAKEEAMRQIHMETQRLMREREVSLPYHRPKKRSLKEFLDRKKFDPILPEVKTMAARVKRCASDVNKIIEEREKEAEELFKSESEDEEDVDKCYIPLPENFNHCNNLLDKNQSVNDKNDKNCQNNHSEIDKNGTNVEEINQNNGVSRKLFLDDDDSSSTQEIIDEKNETDIEQNVQDKLDEDKKNNTNPDETNPESLPENNSSDNSDTKKIEEPVKPMKPVKQKGNLQIFLDQIDEDENTSTKSNEKLILNDKNNWPSQNSIEDIFASPPSISEKSSSFLSIIENSQTSTSSTTTQKSQNLMTLKKLSRLSSMPIPSLQPKLRGTPGMDIDLSEDVGPNKEAIDRLRNRFITKHAVVNKKEENKPEVTVLSTEITDNGVVITNDVLPYSLKTIESNDDPKLNKPGAKYVRLKEELEKKMATKRAEEWRQKEKEFKMDEEEEEEEEEEEKDSCEFDKEKEKIFNEDEEEEAESEPEENDVIIKENKRKNCEFEDDEAEVDDPEMELSDDEEEEEDEDDEEESNDNENTEIGKKKFSRIVTVDEDSDDESSIKETNDNLKKKTIERTRTDVDIFDDNDDDDSVSYQKPPETSQQNSPPPSSTSPSSTIPLTLTTQALTSPSTQKSQLFNSSILESPINPSAEYRRLFGTQNIESTKLFNTQNSQISDNELMSLLSGKFPDSGFTNKPDLKGLINTQLSSQVTDSQLLKLCSGSFTTTKTSKQIITSDNIDDTSQDIRLTLDELSQPEAENENHFKNNNYSSLSSLKSSVTTNASEKSPIKSSVEKNKPAPGWTKFTVVSSSDDESQSASLTVNKRKVLKKKKKVQQLVLSDDEDDNNAGKKVIYDSEKEEEEEEEEILSDDEKFVDYDSEENEIIVAKKDINKLAAKFVDAEAELSESEWGSDDEDERGLDKMEFEAGDAEDIDEDEMRSQIGKVHARQLLDEDQRDVRMLQEMLLDDGDLHDDGAGRERKFKWKNIDSLGMDNLLGLRNNDDDDDNDDDNQIDAANELEYRKLRLEREKFLQEKRKNDDDEDLKLMNGKIFKLGLRMTEKSKTSGCAIDERDEGFGGNIVSRSSSEINKSAVKIPGSLNKSKIRGGFLKRGDAALARLATVIKPSDLNGLKSNNTRNFVFSHISPSIAGPSKNNKTDDEDNCSKEKQVRKRKSTSGMTPTTTKKSRLEVDHLSKKKIF